MIEGGRIVSVGPGNAKADYDLTGLTVMPGWIDTHVHLQWHMDANHKSVSGGVKPEEMALYTAADSWMELEDGFTTVQSVGSTFDGPVRDIIRQGVLPGPRVLTSLIQIQGMGGEGEKRHALSVNQTGVRGFCSNRDAVIRFKAVGSAQVTTEAGCAATAACSKQEVRR